MVKAKKFMLFGMFILIFSFALVSANTLVGGKIYNSDFSEVLEGIVVSVECGSEIPQNTESLSDGAYAVIFDSDKCPFDSSVTVSASEGELTDEESSTVYKSEE
ncbi:MAG: hypothetical protein NTZ83_03455, partial [Candidatus Pacearchaeota archaeon]|nr:hypothetical protein [Candidatus Pacearchaeota archaeon]